MASITINDLALNQALDRKALRCIRGAGSPWTVGTMPLFAPACSAVPVANYFQFTNNFTSIDKMVTQVTSLVANSSGTNSPITAVMINGLNA